MMGAKTVRRLAAVYAQGGRFLESASRADRVRVETEGRRYPRSFCDQVVFCSALFGDDLKEAQRLRGRFRFF